MKKNEDCRKDQQLVEHVRSGNKASFDVIMDRYQQGIYLTILAKTKNSDLAEDLAQDTFIKAYEHLRNPKKPHDASGSLSAWLQRIAFCICMDHFRKAKKMPFMMDVDELMTDDEIALSYYEKSAEEKMIERDDRQGQVRKCIYNLCDNQKEVVLSHDYGEMPFREIAEVSGLSINTVLGRYRYALRHIKLAMAV